MAEQRKIALVGGLATMPTRRRTLGVVLKAVLPQLTRLYLFLDKDESIPDWARLHPALIPLLPRDHGSFGATGKLLPLRLETDPFIYFGLDDDILYPPSYVETLFRATVKYGFKALVGIHGAVYRPPYKSYDADRFFVDFRKGLKADGRVSQLGTGTIAFHSGTLRIPFEDWPHMDMIDLYLAIEAMRQNVPRIALAREAGFLRALANFQPDSLARRTKQDDSRQSRVVQDAIRRHGEQAVLLGE